MASFRDILTGSGEDLIKTFYVYVKDKQFFKQEKLGRIAKELRLNTAQLKCAVGFNPDFKELTEVLPILGYDNIDELIQERNELFINDIYKKLSLDNILAIYSVVKDDPESLQVMQYLLENRLKTIESKIEATVNSMIIEKYKAEMRAIYSDGIADIDFAEKRLNKIDSGFRALLNEVVIITESRLIPAGDIFFRNTVLPEEKRKLLNKGLIPVELVEARLEDENISQQERKMLNDYLKLNKPTGAGMS
ncbi:MAG: hypothetical protein HY356_09025 [Gammaproteobacteria bacterium]|nr:hypothetical protein [Gammaproteobacteria bacterium]